MIAPRYAWLVALVAGVALALSFPPYGFWPLAVLGVALLTFATFQQRLRWGLVTGFVAGLAQFAVLIRWLDVVGVDAWLRSLCLGATRCGGSATPSEPSSVTTTWVVSPGHLFGS